MRNYQLAALLYKLSKEGERCFPRHKGKLFVVKFHPLTSRYVKARRVDQKSWAVWFYDFFIPVPRKV